MIADSLVYPGLLEKPTSRALVICTYTVPGKLPVVNLVTKMI